MTEHDDKEESLAAKEERGREMRSGKLYRLGVFFLAALMFTALILVGGSFSKITSSGTISELPSLTVAGFNVTVEESGEYESGDVYGNNQIVVYSFTVTNASDVDITYDMDFAITIDKELAGLNYILVDESNDDNNIDFATYTSFTYSTKNNGGAFPLTAGGSTIYVLVMDCTGFPLEGNTYDITFSGSITVTATQVKGVQE